ncbi:MAG: preprotein translocase subunit YajC [Pseudomonadota bacterium]|nr:preprotein translocase subunit YajC [Pseudomonadota bacterium]
MPAISHDLVSFVPFLLIFVVFWVLLIRPQQRKLKEHQKMLAALRRGDRIVTGGGIVGQIVKIDAGDEMTVEIAENVRVKVLRSTVASTLAKPEPVPAKTDNGKAE